MISFSTATIASSIACVERGASIVRVHDVAPVRQALDFALRLRGVRQRPFRPRRGGLLAAEVKANADVYLDEKIDRFQQIDRVRRSRR